MVKKVWKLCFLCLMSGVCTTSLSSCNLISSVITSKPIYPMGPVFQYFSEKDGAMGRYLRWIDEKEQKHEISSAQAETYKAEVRAVRNLVEDIKKGNSR